MGRDYFLRVYYTATQSAGRIGKAVVSISIQTGSEQVLTNLNSEDSGMATPEIHERGYFECRVPRLCLRSDIYRCNLFCTVDGEIADWIEGAFAMEVEDGDYFGTGKIIAREQALVLMPYTWENRPLERSEKGKATQCLGEAC